MKITCFGGSSKVFRKAFHALCDSMWTSSIIYILYLEFEGRIFTLSRSSLISSTPLFDAASISIISGFSLRFLHELHSPHAIPSLAFSQLIAFANSFAVEVFPVPLGPLKQYACASLLFIIESLSISFIES